MIVYRVKTRYQFEFVKVMAEKVTESCVFINGSRSAKSSDGVRYFEFFNEAKVYALKHLQKKITQLTGSLQIAQQSVIKTLDLHEDSVPFSTRNW